MNKKNRNKKKRIFMHFYNTQNECTYLYILKC